MQTTPPRRASRLLFTSRLAKAWTGFGETEAVREQLAAKLPAIHDPALAAQARALAAKLEPSDLPNSGFSGESGTLASLETAAEGSDAAPSTALHSTAAQTVAALDADWDQWQRTKASDLAALNKALPQQDWHRSPSRRRPICIPRPPEAARTCLQATANDDGTRHRPDHIRLRQFRRNRLSPELADAGDSEAQALQLLDHARRVGLRRFDTANTYGGGASETFLGKWLRSQGASFVEDAQIATKVGNPHGSPPGETPLSRTRSPIISTSRYDVWSLSGSISITFTNSTA